MQTKPEDYSKMTTAALIAENQRLGAERQLIRGLQLKIGMVLSQRARTVEFEKEIKRLQEKFGPETQIVGVTGIASKQEVSIPG